MKNFLWFTRALIKEIFQISLISYLIFYLIEDLKKSFISNYLNLNYLLIITIATGIICLVILPEEKPTPRKISRKDYLFIIFLGIIAALIIFYKTKTLGWLSWVLAIICGILVVLISILLLKEQSNERS